MKRKKIQYASPDETFKAISPSKNFIPQWYKDIKGYNANTTSFIDGKPVKNVKSCMPFLDSLTSGYMITLSADMHVSDNDFGTKDLFWGGPDALVRIRNSSLSPVPVPHGCLGEHYTWINKSIIKVPKGYSILVTHPFNRHDLPFVTLTGIVDADDLFGIGLVPFFIKKDFTGLIEQGTPIMQVLPFKRENWETKENKDLIKDEIILTNSTSKKFFGYYKNNNWKKKEYN